jgi:catechol 2,3-dioxygenase-like lactoylglutathione lyase family enzyme
MDWKLELVAIPVTDVDQAKAFYVEQVGFHADHDHHVNEDLRFVQLTPLGSACSVVVGSGIRQMRPGSQKGVQIVVDDVEAARRELIGRGVAASEVEVQSWGSFVTFSDPDGNSWELQQAAANVGSQQSPDILGQIKARLTPRPQTGQAGPASRSVRRSPGRRTQRYCVPPCRPRSDSA